MMEFGFLFILALTALSMAPVVILQNKAGNEQAILPVSYGLSDPDHLQDCKL